jgi:hypothetical protein
MDKNWLDKFFSYKDLFPNRTGQAPVEAGAPFWGGRYNYNEKKDIKSKNLGLGWIYYAVTRLYKPKMTVVIGSGKGFLPIIIAKGIKDNNNGGICHFIDPSYDDDFWKNPAKNKQWFNVFGEREILKHHLFTTEEFTKTGLYKKTKKIDLLCIDGSHFYEFVKIDFNSFKNKLNKRALIIFHDSISRSKNPKWSGPRKFLTELLTDKNFQSFDFKFGAGLTLVQKKFFEQKNEYLNFLKRNWKSKNKYEF